jgi:DNA-binding response OmpR family regulator
VDERYFGNAVLDWVLPDISGIEICKLYRDAGGAACILMLTAKGSAVAKAAALDSGADDYLVKPCEPIELLARVRALLRRPQQILCRNLSVGGLTLNKDTHELTVGARLVSLTPRETDILELLMRNVNRYLTADAIFTRLWPADSVAVSSEAIRTHIKELRRKLAENGPMIQSVRTLGYRFVANIEQNAREFSD